MTNAFDDLDTPDTQTKPNAFDDLATSFETRRRTTRVTPGTDPYAIPKTSPLSGESDWQMMLEGIGRGMTNVGRHVGNVLGITEMGETPQERFLTGIGMNPSAPTHPLVSNEALASANELDQPLMSQSGGRLGNVIGETAGILPGAMAAGTGLGAVGAGPLVTGIAEGAGQGALMADPGQKGLGALVGAATGGVVPMLGKAGNAVIQGIPRTPEAQQLIDQGVRLTPGQMNPHGIWNKIEENVRGVPVVGNVVEHARRQAQQDFQRGVIEEAAAPGYTLKSTSKDPNELFTEAQASYKPLYQAATGYPVKPMLPAQNQTLAYALRQAANRKTVGAGSDIRQNAQDFLEGQMEAIGEKARATGGWKSEHLIELRSAINEEMRGAGFDQAGKKYAQLLRGARDQVTNSLNSQIPPEASAALQTANDAYPKLSIIRDAIKRGGDQEQGFTPAQLSQAVKSAAESNEYARGGGLMRDWSSAGRDIFTEQNPKTGASHGTTATLGGLGYAIHHFVPGAQVPAALAGAGALGMIGTQTGREILGGQTAPQRAAQRLIQGLQSVTTPGQRQIASAASRSALNRAAALRALQDQKDQQENQ